MDKIFAYGDTGGSSKFKQAIKTWVFDQTLPLYENHHIEVVATPGGSGSIAITFANYLNPGDKVVLPDIMWETYITFAKSRDCDYIIAPIADNRMFKIIDSFIEGEITDELLEEYTNPDSDKYKAAILQLVNSTRCQIQTWAQAGTSSGIIGGYIPVQKGDNFAVAYTLGSASNQIFRFIYAESEV